MSIIEKIRAEVERRKKKAEHYIEVCKADSRAFEYWSGERDVLELFEREFLSTLQEQPVCEDLEEEIKSWHKKHFKSRNAWEDYSGHYLDKNSQLDLARHFYELGRQSKPKPMEGLEEEIREFVEQEWDGLHDNDGNPLYTADYLEYVARHFAKWQKEQIIKRATTAIKERWYDKFDTTLLGGLIQLGMTKQKEQMMKEAVEGKIIFLLNGDVAVNIGDTDEYKLGQKVRIIIVKEEENGKSD